MERNWFRKCTHHVSLSVLTNCRSQCLLDRHRRCLKLFVSTEFISCHEYASQFDLDFFLYDNNYREYRVSFATVYWNEAPTGHLSPAEPAKLGRYLRHGWAHPPIEQRQHERRRRCVGVSACVLVCMCVCMRACVRDGYAIR